jgi:predicted phosphodiesterase
VRYGIIADIHANVRALHTALASLQQAGIDKYVFLGDLVGYGAEPGECIDIVRVLSDLVPISGNHDRQVIGDKDPQMRRTATRALEWTQSVLTPAQVRYLQSLPQGQMLDDVFILVHGSLLARDAYILSMSEVEANRKCMMEEFRGMKICFFAHTHVPMLIGSKSLVKDLRETKAFQLSQKDVYLINPGSVGQPRDKCPLSSFAIFDSDTWTVTFVRKQYDIPGAKKAIVDAGLPEKFARRLEVGV